SKIPLPARRRQTLLVLRRLSRSANLGPAYFRTKAALASILAVGTASHRAGGPTAGTSCPRVVPTEQKHGSSSKNHIFVPVAGRQGDVNNPVILQQFAPPSPELHLVIAASAGRINLCIVFQHGGNAECIPNAVAPPGALFNADRKRCRDRRKRRNPP